MNLPATSKRRGKSRVLSLTGSHVTEPGYVLDTNIIIERGRQPPDAKVVRWFDSVPFDRLYLTPPVYEELLNGIDDSALGNPTRQRQWLAETRKRYKWLELPTGKSIFMTEAMTRILVLHNGNIPRNIYVDFLIGMIAINCGMVVVTRNERDFRSLGVPITNPFEFER